MKPVVVLVVLSGLMGAFLIGLVGTLLGPGYYLAGVIGFGLAIPVAAATLGFSLRMATKYKFGAVYGLLLGPVVRLPIVLGPALGIFLAARAKFGEDSELGEPLAFWIWVLAAYLVTLVIETVLLARRTVVR
jgi:MFS family permease